MTERESLFSFLRWLLIGVTMLAILSASVASIFVISAGVEWFFGV